MKHAYLLLLALFSAQLFAQNIEFTDPALKTILLNATVSNSIARDAMNNPVAIDINNDNEIQLSEALNISNLLISDGGVTNLSGIEHFSNLKVLSVIYQSNMETFNLSNLMHLEELTCAENSISNLFLSNLPNLRLLQCIQNNNVASLDLSGVQSLETLECSSSSLSQLILPSNLKSIDIRSTQLSTLDLTTLSNLKTLICYYNNISNLNITNLAHLEYVDCSNNLLTTLALDGLDSLESLSCEDNFLTSINIDGAPNLNSLYCYNNSLTSIDFSTNNNIYGISASNNNLTTINVSGCNNLDYLDCSYNQLTSIDLSNNPQLLSLTANYNHLEYLNIRNGHIIQGTENPFYINISNLDVNPPTLYVCVDEDEDPATIGIVQGQAPNSLISTYCSFDPPGPYTALGGTFRYDADNNGCTSNDLSIPFQKTAVNNGEVVVTFIADTTGNYSVSLSEGTYNLYPINPNHAYYSYEPQIITVSISNEPDTQNADFCITPLGIFNDLEIILLPITPARPGFNAVYRLIYKNKGTTTLSGNLTLNYMGNMMDYTASTITPDNVGGNTLIWSFNNLQPFQERSIDFTMNINSPVESPGVNIDDELIFTASVNTADTDETPTDNTYSLNQIVVGSFDPNDKTCVDGVEIHPDMAGEYVTYLIRFENTGTYHAENIVVKDVIDPEKFEINTLLPIQGSHQYFTRIKGDIVEFIFENIMLPGTPNEDRYGYVAFKIKTKETLQENDSFSNTASIYFDYNTPIITNEAITKFVYSPLSTPAFNFNESISLYPNPAGNTLYLNNNSNLILETAAVYNLLGQAVIEPSNISNPFIDISSLAPGTYVIKVRHDKGIYTERFIKK